MTVKRSLINKAKTSEFSKGVFDNVIITNVDTQDRKGQNGPINKMIYIKFAQLNETGKKLSESELAWWKPDVTGEYFKTNLQEICLQLHNVVSSYIGEEEAFEAFSDVFAGLGIEDQADIESKKWKQSELSVVINNLKTSFTNAITPFINSREHMIRLKLSTNFKGEDIEIPKYGKFTESMKVETTDLKFSTSELKTHSKIGNVESKGAASSSNTGATI